MKVQIEINLSDSLSGDEIGAIVEESEQRGVEPGSTITAILRAGAQRIMKKRADAAATNGQPRPNLLGLRRPEERTA